MSIGDLHVPFRLRRGARRRDEHETVASAAWLIEHMCEHLGLPDLGNVEVLDWGCGVKFTQALINNRLPVGRYVGVDVEPDMIEFLRCNVSDPRFEFHHVDAHNELYNPNGRVLETTTPLPIDGQAFDVICLFSVFTHLAPHDFKTLLELLRRFPKPGGRLFFTLYLDERTEGGHGLMDQWDEIIGALPHEVFDKWLREHPESAQPLETFRDLDPEHPLKWAVYSERYARELIDAAGWRSVLLCPPSEFIQHHFACEPA